MISFFRGFGPCLVVGRPPYALDEFGQEDFYKAIDGVREVDCHLDKQFDALLLRYDLSFGLQQDGFGKGRAKLGRLAGCGWAEAPGDV